MIWVVSIAAIASANVEVACTAVVVAQDLLTPEPGNAKLLVCNLAPETEVEKPSSQDGSRQSSAHVSIYGTDCTVTAFMLVFPHHQTFPVL